MTSAPAPSVIVHYGELALKGRNRPWFVNTLVRAIRRALVDIDLRDVRSHIGRIVIRLGPTAAVDEVRERLARLPGIGNFGVATYSDPTIEAMTATALSVIGGHSHTGSFRVTARRADKRFPFPSPQIERAVGSRVQDVTGWTVDLSKPQLVIRVEVLTDEAYIYVVREKGVGGLPVGTGGKVMSLLSGGIDSPVAAWRLIRRGCRSHFVHFHSYPILARTSQDKARELVRQLTRYQLASRLYLVAFGSIQQQVVLAVPPPLRTVIYRRLMMRIAERLAQGSGAHALVTGDAVGQVASQTIDNLAVIGSVATMPVLRPLIGMDKEEITRDAQHIGTYETSIVPDDDCCTLFTPRYPATRASPRAVALAEGQLPIETLVEQAVAESEREDFRFPR